ncbi:MAG: sigma-70 family RNA polymerase sigma factor [Dysgonamonadaceae bacterium]|jgi:RNA polymerase sigma-70 factor (ECF subfamily)|nr:sigma-70 family RNA polymerase sigma factor [Dysgonamonadaceae bacterium]
MKLYNEEETLRQLKSTDINLQKNAFEQIVSFYSDKLYRQIRKMVLSHDDANDLLQDTFIKAWKNVNLFRGEAKLSSWLYRIALNESITFLNKQRTQNNVSLDNKDSFPIEKLESDSYFDGDALQLKLQEAIFKLPEKQKIIFNMRYYGEMPYEKISEILGTSVGTAKASYHHAVKKIEDFLNLN